MNRHFKLNSIFFGRNKCTGLFVILQGILAGICGIVHGAAEALRGNIPTGGFILPSVGAFTVIHNYLLTGLATMLVALSVTLWTVFFIHKKDGPAIFLSLSAVLFLVGGGIAQVLFFVIAWAVSTRINKPLTWWKKILPQNMSMVLAKLWPPAIITGYFFLTVGIGIWLLFVPPSAAYHDMTVEHVCWAFLCTGLIVLILAIVSGFARDIENR